MSYGEDLGPAKPVVSPYAELEAETIRKSAVDTTEQERLRGWAIREYRHVQRIVLWAISGTNEDPRVDYHCDLPTDRGELDDLAATIDDFLVPASS